MKKHNHRRFCSFAGQFTYRRKRRKTSRRERLVEVVSRIAVREFVLPYQETDAMAGIPHKSWQPANVSLETTMGTVVCEMYWKQAPNTCRNFAELGRRGYYNGVKFHRIIKDFMIQGGDPTATGRGGASIYGKHFEDELTTDLKHTGAGILSMANSGPDTNGSQFFITLGPTQWLDNKHTIFGRVCAGMNVINRMGMVETDSDDRPMEEIKILKAAITIS